MGVYLFSFNFKTQKNYFLFFDKLKKKELKSQFQIQLLKKMQNLFCNLKIEQLKKPTMLCAW